MEMLLGSLGMEAPLGLGLAQGLELVPPFLQAAGFGVGFVPALPTESYTQMAAGGLPGCGSLSAPMGSFVTLKYRHQP